MSNAMTTIAATPITVAPDDGDSEREEDSGRISAAESMTFVLGNPAPAPSMDEIRREFSHTDSNDVVDSSSNNNDNAGLSSTNDENSHTESSNDQNYHGKHVEGIEFDYVEHTVLPSDTFQGICLAYGIKPHQLRQANGFSGSNLLLAPSKLVIPLHVDTDPSKIKCYNKNPNEMKIHLFLAEIPQMKLSEAKAYLELADWDVEGAIAIARQDSQWEKGINVAPSSTNNGENYHTQSNRQSDHRQDVAAATAGRNIDQTEQFIQQPMAVGSCAQDRSFAVHDDATGTATVAATPAPSANVVDPPTAEWTEELDEKVAACIQGADIHRVELDNVADVIDIEQNERADELLAMQLQGQDANDYFLHHQQPEVAGMVQVDDQDAVRAELIGRDYTHIAATTTVASAGGVAAAATVTSTCPPSVSSSSSSLHNFGNTTETSSFATMAVPPSSPIVSVSAIDAIPPSNLDNEHISSSDASTATVAAVPAGVLENSGTRGEGQATIVEIEEDVHPADIDENEVTAVFTGTVPSPSFRTASHGSSASPLSTLAPVSVGDQEATVVAVEENSAPSTTMLHGDSIATLASIDRNPARSNSASCSSLDRKPISLTSLSSRAMSEPSTATATATAFPPPFEEYANEFSPDTVRDDIASNAWLNIPTAVSPSRTTDADEPIQVIPPPPVLNSLRPEVSEVGPLDMPTPSASFGHSRISQEETNLPSNESQPPVPTRRSSAPADTRVESSGTATSETGSSATNSSNGSSRRSLAPCTFSTVMEKLFGDSKPSRRGSSSADGNSAAASILPRTQLPASVFRNQTTKTWVATINTNQKALDNNDIQEASRALKAYSVPSRLQAEEIARSMAPPRMIAFNQNKSCFMCESKFAVFKRACHCRNCGVCICAGCAVSWSSKMIPETFNIKGESTVNICKSCDWLCSAFRTALLNGEHDEAVALHATGNVNLITPFANVKGELFYPVHCAVLGGRLSLLKWLVDDHFCPIQYTTLSSIKSSSRRTGTVPILTSKGRSVLGIAMTEQYVDIVRYLVVSKGLSLHDEKGLTLTTVINTLDAALRKLPAEDGESSSDFINPTLQESSYLAVLAAATNQSQQVDLDATAPPGDMKKKEAEDEVSLLDDNACIICYSNHIDSVATPCGHCICCLECSANITTCPVCTKPCTFIRVYKP